MGTPSLSLFSVSPSHTHKQNTQYEAYQGCITNIQRYFINEVLIKGRQPLSTLDDAVIAQRIVEAAEASAKNNGQPVDLRHL